MYGVKPLDQNTCTKTLAFFKNEAGYLNFVGRYVPEEQIFRACGAVMGAAISDTLFPNVEDGTAQVLRCTGTARYSSGGDERSCFYLERFPDGEEYWGVRQF